MGRGLTLAVVALGLFAGLLAVFTAGASAQSTSPTAPPQRVYALTQSDNLLLFNGNAPRETTRIPIRGLNRGESLVGIDFRPANSLLYGVGDENRIYTINENTGVARPVSTLSVPLEGERFGVDFNPVPDRLRIVSDTDQNLRVNVDTGVTTVDGDLAYASGDDNAGENPNVTAAAYTNNTPPSPRDPPPPAPDTPLPDGPGTTLYDIDTDLDILAIQNPPNDGTLNTVGELRENVKSITGFDIVTTGPTNSLTNRAFAALQPRGSSNSAFYRVNLQTGQVTRIDRIDGRRTDVEGLAIPIGQP